MKIVKSPIAALSLVVGAIMLGACTSLDCSINNIVALNVSIPDTVSNDTLNVYTIVNSNDTALYTNGTNVTSLSLPMSYAQETDSYLFAFTDTTGTTVTDTVAISKTNEPHFESVDCTPQYWHNIESVTTTHNRLDSITINDRNVNNDQTATHIILHLHSR